MVDEATNAAEQSGQKTNKLVDERDQWNEKGEIFFKKVSWIEKWFRTSSNQTGCNKARTEQTKHVISL